ncbi:adenine phosphoribosyltransferase [Pseudoalteromonas tunicata]|jgi:adenine phosphoribosyltransferase|uniref:Adenine phosphoribosyltransferase n=1 Tax=Pseudoalteromonas tunicata D2 TaxID=87626 RepID=A4C5Q0_9GAMM|nr:adenine phosphoribosyltransferase [Pseudoalteromonas tunicata]ATC95279.1 adenine phosphoribosyltransferase [Pseudoalteromonas tunicata]AXT30881.1 adenine phosphoribosyltransferase [Pseudoalteromonas tunicata]EAR29304.1 adenine phosphoribosyltransferase [Pseudoalteromonas tunicata D2]MDP4985387.1 adenine phosphoribosyltransferase [Pseudoalteromonas tunicata]MDP5213128.1 adenine phosphoribosyltransferase [Pseudoalteromonas tunicata]
MTQSTLDYIKASIATVPNYPKAGIMFRDVTSLIADPVAFKAVIDAFVAAYQAQGFDKIIGTESRGFIFGAPLAIALGIPFIPVRKPGKLPREVISQAYQLEYGEDVLEIHTDAISQGDKVLLVDDLLATGGTIEATIKLVERLGGHASDAAFVVSLPELGGEQRLEKLGINILKLVEFEGE